MAKYLGNKGTKEVHNTYNEKSNCQLAEIRDQKMFTPDTLQQAYFEGYDNCHWCIGRSTK